MDLNTSLSRARPLATAAGALATLTASLSVVPLFDSGRWIIPTIAGVLTMALTGAVARVVSLPPPLQPILQVLVLLTLLTTALFALTAFAVAVLSHHQTSRSRLAHLPQIGLSSGALLITFGCWLWRLPDVMASLQLSESIPPVPH